MEPLNNSLKNIVQFILCVQDACDNHRKSMEHLWQQEYTTYINEWKPSQNEIKLPDVKNDEVKSHDASKCVQMDSGEKPITEADLELTLADSLLEKARTIRTKNKKIMNGLTNYRNIPILCTDKVPVSSVNYNLKQGPDKIRSRKTLPQSKSDIVINNCKPYAVPRSKSASTPLMPKSTTETLCDSKSCIALSSKNIVMKHTNSLENNTSKDFAVISSKDLNKLKTLQLNLPSCHDSKGRKVTQSSDSSKNRYQQRTSSHPSSSEFFNLIKERLNNIACEVKLRTWYPFLSQKNEAFLTAFSYKSLSSMKRVCSILHNIQETMIWIDLLHLLETEICPNLIVDVTDVNSLRVYSYLHSIYHPNLKRTPIIFPIRQ